jgi:hypothetical protein
MPMVSPGRRAGGLMREEFERGMKSETSCGRRRDQFKTISL